MKPTFVVRPFASSEWNLYKALRLRSLVESPDAYRSTLADEALRGDDFWSERVLKASLSDRERLFGLFADGTAAGLVWALFEREDPTSVGLFQMWVAPEVRGQGQGQVLLDTAIEWAISKGAASLFLGVTSGNTSAERMYIKAGFQPDGPLEPLRKGSPLPLQWMRLRLDGKPADQPLRG